jgi:hypothetical protein
MIIFCSADAMHTGKLTDGIIPVMNPVLLCSFNRKLYTYNFEIMGFIIHIPE